MIDENKCIQEISKGNEKALKDLYDLYSQKVYNTILSYTKNEEDAQELLQDVFVTVYNSAGSFKFNSSVSTWIYRISINKSIDFIRKKDTRNRKGLLSLFKPGSTQIEHDVEDFAHPGVRMEQKEDAKLLFKVIDELSENQKTAFILTQVEGLSQQETADIMEITRKAVESLVQRAKANLRKSLEKYFPNRGDSQKNTTK
ncbi:MAG: RNA polymerase sigma factor [Balneola sp.]|nr:MAG: RNA polymerase sigma factor [Balneola sp.]